MRGRFAFLLVGALASLPAPSRAEDTPTEPARCVTLASSWELALKDGKERVVPIVVHTHGFYCSGCWKVHAKVMCDPGYVDFAYESAVEVLVLDRLKEGVEKKEPAASTYEVKQGGKTVQHLLAFPGLRVEDVLALNESKAGTYNKEGKLPYTSLVDPFTEVELKSFKGWDLTADELKAGVTEAREALAKAHGKGKARPDLKAFADGAAVSAPKLEKGDFAGALDPYTALLKRAEKESWPLRMRERISKAHAEIIAAATDALDNVESDKLLDAAKAKTDLTALIPRLRGTGLEKRAKDLLATL